MKFALRHWLAAAMLPLMFAKPASAQNPAPAAPPYEGPGYVVSYIETSPADAAKAKKLLADFAKSVRKESGNTAFIALQRVGEPNFFTVLEAWKDRDTQTAHASAPATKTFRDKLEPLLRAPYDERPHLAMAANALKAGPKSAIYVVTHVDIVPTSKDAGIEMNKALAESARGEPGAVSFDLWQQGSRPNHLTLVEVWKDRKALDAHNSGDAVKAYRGKFAAISGSPYDIRVFKAID